MSEQDIWRRVEAKQSAMAARIAELEAALRSVAVQCDNVIFNCEQRPADNDRHLSSWRSVRDYAKQSAG